MDRRVTPVTSSCRRPGKALSFGLGLLLGGWLAGPAWAETPSKPVALFTQTFCPSCLAAKRFFEREGVEYREFDIETSPVAREYFEKLGGRGTPFLVVNGQRLQGFDEERFRALYRRGE